MPQQIKGIFNILATPFAQDRSIDIPSLKRLVTFQMDKGAHGLTILGVLGEAAKLSLDERRLVMDIVVETVNGRIPIVVGTSHPEVQICIELSQAAFSTGASGVMIAPPRLENPTDEKVLTLYQQIAEKVDQPIVVQDFPPVNDIVMSPEFLANLADSIPNARHLKLEDPPLMQKIEAIRALTDEYEIFGGLGGMFLLEELQRGASGTMTGFAFTEILVKVYTHYQNGHITEAEQIFDRYLPLIRYENQPVINLSIRKALLQKRGAIAHGILREPFAAIDEGTRTELDWLLQRMGINDPTQKLDF